MNRSFDGLATKVHSISSVNPPLRTPRIEESKLRGVLVACGRGRLAPWPRAARFARCCAWWTAVWCHHRQRREAGAPPTNLSTSCVLRGGVSEMPALGAVLTANCHESYRNVHDRSPRAMLHSSGGACASSRRGNYHKEEREPLEKASIHVEYEAECRRQAIRFAIRFRQHCAVASAARVTPPAPLHTSSERMVTHSPGPLAGQRSEIPR